MATFASGNGGYVVFGSVRLDVQKWTLRKNARLVENTHSGVAATNFELVVPDHSWSVECPLDITNVPDDQLGLSPGSKGTVAFYVGATGRFNVLAGTSVETIEEVDDNSQDIVRVTISGKGGVLTPAA